MNERSEPISPDELIINGAYDRAYCGQHARCSTRWTHVARLARSTNPALMLKVAQWVFSAFN